MEVIPEFKKFDKVFPVAWKQIMGESEPKSHQY
ncbi:hypothetical protein CCACVL1_10964 [Corchorus capsularis]|uniref:Uncharacterized protein n=1 Tax=Corchorus capsularis TaxID=210143 RepID=A0A1R3INP8_COCAP|nr:hypothetical protein CCACVL1_10964 [Corchorus capsularis]